MPRRRRSRANKLLRVGHAINEAVELGNEALAAVIAVYRGKPIPQQVPRPVKSPKLSSSSAERRVLSLTNAARLVRGLHPPLRLHSLLTSAARSHTRDQAFVRLGISHTGTDGSSLSIRVKRQGYRYMFAAENVARGQLSPEHVFRSWMSSRGHRKNILNGRAREMGLYVTADNNGKLFWTQVFGTRK